MHSIPFSSIAIALRFFCVAVGRGPKTEQGEPLIKLRLREIYLQERITRSPRVIACILAAILFIAHRSVFDWGFSRVPYLLLNPLTYVNTLVLGGIFYVVVLFVSIPQFFFSPKNYRALWWSDLIVIVLLCISLWYYELFLLQRASMHIFRMGCSYLELREISSCAWRITQSQAAVTATIVAIIFLFRKRSYAVDKVDN